MKNIAPRTLTGSSDEAVQDYELRHAALSRRAAAEGIVLLKNEGKLLPLSPASPLALYGRGAAHTVRGGGGSGEVNARYSVDIFTGLKNAGFNIVNEEHIEKYNSVYNSARAAWREMMMKEYANYSDGALFFENVYGKNPFLPPPELPFEKFPADTAVYVLSRRSGEASDRSAGKGDYLLDDNEEKLLADICANYAKVIVILNVGGVVDLSFMDRHKNILALLLLSQPGAEGGNALADVLSGKVNPCGKLTDTWALRYGDYPCADSFSGLGDPLRQEYREGIYVGYRWFDSFSIPVRYCFGHGLSYTDFDIRAQSLDFLGKNLCLGLEVKNCGSVPGKEVVQLYTSCPQKRLCREFRRLTGYAKTALLAPGGAQHLEIEFSPDLLASYDESAPGWLLEEGEYILWLGNSLDSSRPIGRITLDRDALLEITKNLCSPLSPIAEYAPPKPKHISLPDDALSLALSANDLTTHCVEYGRGTAKHDEAEAIAVRLSTEQLIRMVCGDPGKSQTSGSPTTELYVPGAAAETSSSALEHNVVPIVLADGPAGLRLSKFYDVDEGKIIPRGFLANLEGGELCPDTGVQGERRYQYCTAFPVGTLLAQTWDSALLREVGAAVAEEMSRFGVTLWLAPGMNIHRNPLCGRNFEYYSEDPLLSGLSAAAITIGVQSKKGCGVTVKHFAANNCENERMHSDSIMSERAMREIYLKGFETAVKNAAPMAIMSSYNKLNGTHTAALADLCTSIARDEWGFEGVIMTDWTVTTNAGDCSARDCILAGNDLIMPGDERDFSALRAALADDTLSEDVLRLCASRVIRTALKSVRYEE